MPLHIKGFIIIPITIVAWLIATFVTKPVPLEKLNEFYRRVRPGGFWGPVDDELKKSKDNVLSPRFLLDWIAGLALAFGVTFAIGHYIFKQFTAGIFWTAVAIGGFWWIACMIRSLPDESPAQE